MNVDNNSSSTLASSSTRRSSRSSRSSSDSSIIINDNNDNNDNNSCKDPNSSGGSDRSRSSSRRSIQSFSNHHPSPPPPPHRHHQDVKDIGTTASSSSSSPSPLVALKDIDFYQSMDIALSCAKKRNNNKCTSIPDLSVSSVTGNDCTSCDIDVPMHKITQSQSSLDQIIDSADDSHITTPSTHNSSSDNHINSNSSSSNHDGNNNNNNSNNSSNSSSSSHDGNHSSNSSSSSSSHDGNNNNNNNNNCSSYHGNINNNNNSSSFDTVGDGAIRHPVLSGNSDHTATASTAPVALTERDILDLPVMQRLRESLLLAEEADRCHYIASVVDRLVVCTTGWSVSQLVALMTRINRVWHSFQAHGDWSRSFEEMNVIVDDIQSAAADRGT